MKKKFEICLDSVQSIINAEKGGAARVELCDALFDGGTTPSLGTLRVAKNLTKIPIQVMIRPRGGDFCYSEEEFLVMKEDIKIFKEEGVNGVVFGILKPDGSIDVERNQELFELASGLDNTFHRAIDVSSDWKKSLDALMKIGFKRILTSGLEDSVLEGSQTICDMIEYVQGRMSIMPGCGISPRNFDRIDGLIGADEYHLAIDDITDGPMQHRPSHIFMGGILRPAEFSHKYTSIAQVKKLAQ